MSFWDDLHYEKVVVCVGYMVIKSTSSVIHTKRNSFSLDGLQDFTEQKVS